MTTSSIIPGTRFAGRYLARGEEGYEAARRADLQHPPPRALPRSHPLPALRPGHRRRRPARPRERLAGGSPRRRAQFPRLGLRDDAMLVDLGELKEIEYDPATHIASVSPAVQGGAELNEYLRPHGRFFAGGRCPTVGVGGFLLQAVSGGTSAAGAGRRSESSPSTSSPPTAGSVRADEEQNSDLFWAARGCGPGFPGSSPASTSTPGHPEGADHHQAVLPDRDVRRRAGLAQRGAEVDAEGQRHAGHVLPAGLRDPRSQGGYIFGISSTAYCDTEEEALAILAPLDDNPYLADALMVVPPTPTTLSAEYAFVDAVHPAGFRYRVESAWVDGPPAEIAESGGCSSRSGRSPSSATRSSSTPFP